MSGYGSGCGISITQTVPTRYNYKTVPAHCGQTGYYGYPVFCDACAKKNEGRDFRREAIEAGEQFDEEE